MNTWSKTWGCSLYRDYTNGLVFVKGPGSKFSLQVERHGENYWIAKTATTEYEFFSDRGLLLSRPIPERDNSEIIRQLEELKLQLS